MLLASKYRRPSKDTHTQARSEQSDVEIGNQLLGIRIKHALTGGDIPRQADAYYLQDGLENQQDQIKERWMAAM